MLFNLGLCFTIIIVYLLTRLGKKDKKDKDKLFLFVSFFILFILVAFRGFVIGNDTSDYVNLYNECNTYKWDILRVNSYYERGYLIFNVLLSYLHLTPRLFLIILALISSWAIYSFIKSNSKNYLMSILMYVNLMFFYQSMNIMRQFLALSIVLFGFNLIKEKKFWKYAFVVLLASLIHSTAFLAILIYPIYHFKYTRKRVLAIVICSVIGLLILNYLYPLIMSVLGRETYYMSVIGETKLANIILTLIFLVMYVFSLFVIKKDERNKYGFYLYSLLLAAAINYVAIDMSVLGRAAQYYAILSIVSLPNVVDMINSKNRIIIESIIIGLLMVYSSTVIISRPEWNSAYNYRPCVLQEEGFSCE